MGQKAATLPQILLTQPVLQLHFAPSQSSDELLGPQHPPLLLKIGSAQFSAG